MAAIARIDDDVITTDDFIRILKLTGQFEGLIEHAVRDRLTVRAAKKQGVSVAPEEIQERADAAASPISMAPLAEATRASPPTYWTDSSAEAPLSRRLPSTAPR